jgi:phosphate-selective porin OprO and OprP
MCGFSACERSMKRITHRRVRRQSCAGSRHIASLVALLCTLQLLSAPRAAAQQPPETKTASRTYFETLGSFFQPRGDDEAFPRPWVSKDGRMHQLRGRIDLDGYLTHQSAGDVFAYGDLGNVLGLRRARIGGEGDLKDDRRYVWEIDMATGDVVPRDIFLSRGTPPEGHGERRWGHYREPFSLEGNISANYYMFMERSPINDLDPARGWGLCFFQCNPDETATFALGLFHNGSDQSDFDAGDGANASVTARFTTAPILEDDGRQLLHFGLALSERIPEDGVAIFNQHPRATLLDPSDSTLSPFVPEIEIPSHFVQLFNLQLATCDGPLWTQSEWYGAIVPQLGGGGTVFLHGCYASVGYFLTGENRAYQKQTGVLGPVSVRRPLLHGAEGRGKPHGWGSWELTARFSYLNFNDADLPTGPAGQNIGTVLPQATFGVNWHLADRMRVMFNYSYEAPWEANVGRTEASLFGMRLNVFF